MTDQTTSELRSYRLDDRYLATEGTVVLTGLQAITRVLLDRHRIDADHGKRTGGVVSGYPGSPLGGFDLTLGKARPLLEAADVKHVPGINEELAASVVWGTQQSHIVGLRDGIDGIFGMWYGKSPGADRCGDVFKHANAFSVDPNGGVVAVVGDDPAAKSSSLPSQSETIFYDAAIPVLSAGSVQELLHLGLQASELSRYSGLWVALKVVTNIADGVGVVDVDHRSLRLDHPSIELDGEPWTHRRRLDTAGTAITDRERDVLQDRHRAAQAFAAHNGINRIEGARRDAWIGFVAGGKTYYDLRQSLSDLGFGDAALEAAGIRLLKLGMIYPLEQGIVREFADGLERIVVVEEKRDFIESAVRNVLYASAHRPVVVGKRDEDGRLLVPYDSELTGERLRPALTRQLSIKLTVSVPEAPIVAAPTSAVGLSPTPMRIQPADLALVARTPAYCSGCPHNRSTVLPEGAVMGGGVGCHGMSYMDQRLATSKKFGVVPMGSEGVPWIGLASFSPTQHVFQNLGDGTYTHSGLLGVRACVAAGVNITFKILYNGYIAMTGGQDVAGGLTVAAMSRELEAEGVKRIVVVTEDLDRYRGVSDLAPGVDVVHRDDLERVQEQLQTITGVSAVIYDQVCAAEARRMRGRGEMPVPQKTVVINELVCEGCGDCAVKSNCLSVQPVETELGRKTQIHQSSCNSDFSCLAGDCPSFITLRPTRGGKLTGRTTAKRRRSTASGVPAVPPEPSSRPEPGADPYSIYMIGIGGTGVVTANHILATAALLDGLHTTGLDQTGMSQKAGAVASHLKVSTQPLSDRAAQVGTGEADLYLVFDVLSGAGPLHLGRAGAGRTATVVSTTNVPTASIVTDLNRHFPSTDALVAHIAASSRPDAFVSIDAQAAAEAEFGDHMVSNTVLMGVAYQSGWLPMRGESIEAAITLNGVAVDRNIAAFQLGRRLAVDPSTAPTAAGVHRLGSAPLSASAGAAAEARRLVGGRPLPDAVRLVAESRAAELIDYQGEALAHRYLELVGKVVAAERSVDPDRTDLSVAVARGFYKLLAYKDEYEVARLHLKVDLAAQASDDLGVAMRPTFHLHPPTLRALGKRDKIEVGPWILPVFRGLRSMRRVRGTRLDPFGYAASRRLERQLIDEYAAAIDVVARELTPDRYDAAVTTASAPDVLRGYEDVKLATVPAFRSALGAFSVTPAVAAR
jgi:indolepyruvate ferredoxin oxidoreductase